MKKIISPLLLLTFVFSTACLTSCGRKQENGEPMDMKLGIGVHTDTVTQSATGDKNGALEAVHTVAAVVLDTNGKIVKCMLDAIESSVAFTKDGKGIATGEFKSKRELGDSYVMSTDASKLKWYQQADAFAKLCEGKTVEEVKDLVGSGGKGNQDVISSGCTIVVSEFALAIEKSATDLKQFTAPVPTAIKLKLAVQTKATDAKSDTSGAAEIVCKATASLDGSDNSASVEKSEKASVSFNSSGVIHNK